jgi:arylsulfatase A-like enzyme
MTWRALVGIACAWWTVVGMSASAQEAGRAARPNVVLVITDDLGWADLSSYGAIDVRTPNIDSLARDGVRFAQFYSVGVLCSPTRAGLISGRYQQRYGIETALSRPSAKGSDIGLPATGRSLPQLLADGGYATGLVGKWHLGYAAKHGPLAHGFGYFFGLKSGYHDYYTHDGNEMTPDLWEGESPGAAGAATGVERQVRVEGYTTDLLTQRAVAFIERHASRPFFLEVAYNAPHWPYQPPDKPSVAVDRARHVMPGEEVESTRADYVAMVERVDRGVGDLLRTLDRLDLARNTLVIFTNDNGGEWLSDNGPLFNRKWTVWEGGIRVPLLVRWPGRVESGVMATQVGHTLDLTASVVAATGVPVPADTRLDGQNLLPVLAGSAPVAPRTLFWRTAVGGRQQKAVRRGDWKLVVDGTHTFLYDLARDTGERTDLARSRQDVVRDLRPLLAAWEADVDAEFKARGPSTGPPPEGTTVPVP